MVHWRSSKQFGFNKRFSHLLPCWQTLKRGNNTASINCASKYRSEWPSLSALLCSCFLFIVGHWEHGCQLFFDTWYMHILWKSRGNTGVVICREVLKSLRLESECSSQRGREREESLPQISLNIQQLAISRSLPNEPLVFLLPLRIKLTTSSSLGYSPWCLGSGVTAELAAEQPYQHVRGGWLLQAAQPRLCLLPCWPAESNSTNQLAYKAGMIYSAGRVWGGSLRQTCTPASKSATNL